MPNLQVLLMDDAYWADVPDVLSLEAAASIVRRTKHTLYRWVSSGKFPAHYIGGVWIVYKESMRRWVEDDDNPHTLPEAFLASYPEELTALELAKLVGRTRQTVYSWLDNGDLIGHRISGRMWLLYKSELITVLRRTASEELARSNNTGS